MVSRIQNKVLLAKENQGLHDFVKAKVSQQPSDPEALNRIDFKVGDSVDRTFTEHRASVRQNDAISKQLKFKIVDMRLCHNISVE
jgi:hypothetical protein